MKRLMLLLGSTTLLNSCAGKDDNPPLARVVETGGSTSTAGGRVHSGGQSSTDVGGMGTVGGVSSAGGDVGLGGGSGLPSSSIGGATSADTTLVDPKALAPLVRILSPSAVVGPSPGSDAGVPTGPVLTDSPIEVVCQATKGTAPEAVPVLPSSVKIAIQPSGGAVVAKHGTPLTGQMDTYAATFPIQDLPSGALAISCAAADQSMPARQNTATISAYIDHGPVIRDVVPIANAAFALKASVHFEFRVLPQELFGGDVGSEIGAVQLKVADLTITPTLDARGYYTAEVNFGDATRFPQVLSGQVPVVISAANKREKPKPATATSSYYILLDGTPPTITITNPPAGAVIGGQQTLAFSVSDTLSGVDTQMVIVNLGANQSVGYPYKADDPLTWKLTNTAASSNFSFTFDSSKFDKTDSQVSVSVIASDVAGNQSTSQVNLYYLDNQPPFVSLDPPNIRLLTPAPENKYYCSKPFDPLGPAMPNNGQIVNSFEFYRAFVWDMTNGKDSQKLFSYAGVDRTKVQLFVQPDSTKGIIYDKSGDGLCDSIDEGVKSMPGQPYLVAVTDFGAADTNANDYSTVPSVAGLPCTSQVMTPTRLCALQSSDMTVAVHQVYPGQSDNISAIYAVQALPSAVQCTGLDWDISGKVQEGWICLAAQAADSIGNVGVSAPIAVCFDNEETASSPPCATGARGQLSAETPPTCVKAGCRAPSRSLVGDTGPVVGSVVNYDTGHPIPFVVEYRQ